QNAPSVRQAFESDLVTQALIGKRTRSLRMDEQLRCTGVLPGIDHAIMPEPPCSLELQCGRPRMPTKLVFIFSMIRGWFGGSILSAKSRDCLIESQSLAALLDSEGVSLPGATTILENI